MISSLKSTKNVWEWTKKWYLFTPQSWSTCKSSSTSFRVRAAPESWSKYTTLMVILIIPKISLSKFLKPLPRGDQGVHNIQLWGASSLVGAWTKQEKVEVDPALNLNKWHQRKWRHANFRFFWHLLAPLSHKRGCFIFTLAAGNSFLEPRGGQFYS